MLASGSSGITPLPGEQRGGLCTGGPCGGEPGCSAVSLPHCWPRQLGPGMGENSCPFLRWLLGMWCDFRNVEGLQGPVWGGGGPSMGMCSRSKREGKQRGAFQALLDLASLLLFLSPHPFVTPFPLLTFWFPPLISFPFSLHLYPWRRPWNELLCGGF